MHSRCYGRGAGWRHYHGRGIAITFDWMDYFTFRAWAIENGYRKNLTIERINNDESYRPDNCRWITRAEQNLNQRHTKHYEINGETITQAELERRMGFSRGVISSRIKYQGERVVIEACVEALK